VATAVAALALTSCGGDDSSEAHETTTTTAEPATTTTTLSPEAEVEAAYHEFEAVMAELAVEPDPDDPRLAELVLPPELDVIREDLQRSLDTNQVFELSDQSAYEIVNVTIDQSGDSATAIVCSVAADRVVDRDSGHVVTEGVNTLRTEFQFSRQGTRWLITDMNLLDAWVGDTNCDA